MAKINCLNPIAKIGLNNLPAGYALTDNTAEADGILVRSAKMNDMEFSDNLLAIACAAQALTTSPLTDAQRRESLYSTHPAQTQTVLKSLYSQVCSWLQEISWAVSNG